MYIASCLKTNLAVIKCTVAHCIVGLIAFINRFHMRSKATQQRHTDTYVSDGRNKALNQLNQSLPKFIQVFEVFETPPAGAICW